MLAWGILLGTDLFTQFIYLPSTLRSCFNFYSCIGVSPLQLRGSNSDACKQIRLDLAGPSLFQIGIAREH